LFPTRAPHRRRPPTTGRAGGSRADVVRPPTRVNADRFVVLTAPGTGNVATGPTLPWRATGSGWPATSATGVEAVTTIAITRWSSCHRPVGHCHWSPSPHSAV
jgi:hypothetical protein